MCKVKALGILASYSAWGEGVYFSSSLSHPPNVIRKPALHQGPTEGWVKGSPTACSTVIVGRCAMWAGIPPSMPDNTGLAWELGMRVGDRSRVLVRRSKQIGQGRLVGKDIFKLCSAFLHIFKSQYPVFQKILLLKTNPFQNRSQSHFKLLDFAQFLIYLNYRWF